MPNSSSDASSSTGADSQDERWDDWQDDQPMPAISLFSSDSFPSALEALQHDKQRHGVDITLLASTLDFFERIRLINWIRATKPDPASLKRLDRDADFLQDDAYLKPVIQDDVLLQFDFDHLSLGEPSSARVAGHNVDDASPTRDSDLIDNLRAQLYDSHQAMEQLKTIIRDRLGESMGLDAVAESDREAIVKPLIGDNKGKGVDGKERDDDSHYFESYAYNDIHEIMLKDKVRTDSYRDFIMSNPQLFKDAVVLDVGCGTGILSMFAARSGAKKVYAVDASNVAFKAQRNIKANGLSEVITVIKGKVEEIEIPEKVDIIVSEWMGYMLLYECMLDSVLSARDRYMKPTGLMVPSQTSIMLSLFAGSSLVNDRIKFWDNVYGFDMSAMKEEIPDDALIDVVDGKEVVSEVISISDIVTQTTTVAELSFTSPFSLTATKATTVNAFLGHFDTFFTTDARRIHLTSELKEGEVSFTTGAHDTPTHWKQTMFLLREPIEVQHGTVVEGSFKCGKNPDNSRELVIEMTWTVSESEGKKGAVKAQVWKVR